MVGEEKSRGGITACRCQKSFTLVFLVSRDSYPLGTQAEVGNRVTQLGNKRAKGQIVAKTEQCFLWFCEQPEGGRNNLAPTLVPVPPQSLSLTSLYLPGYPYYSSNPSRNNVQNGLMWQRKRRHRAVAPAGPLSTGPEARRFIRGWFLLFGIS